MEKSKYEKTTIGDLERQVEEQNRLARGAQKEMIEILIYIKTSGRWKENKRYERASFYAYIDDRFNIRRGTFMEMQTAYVKYPDQSIEYGIGLMARIIRECGGAVKAKKVLNEMDDAKKQLKRGLNRAQIDKIITKHATPKIKKHVTDWKAMYEAEAKAHEATKNNLKIAIARVRELEGQVARLKVTAERISDIRAIIEKPAVMIQPQA